MSIGFVAAAELSGWAWIIWLAAAIAAAWVVTRRGRGTAPGLHAGKPAAANEAATADVLPYAVPDAPDRATGPLLIGVGVIAFIVYLAAAVAYLSYRDWATRTPTTRPTLSAGEMAWAALLPGLIAWATAVAFLRSAGVLHAVGYDRVVVGTAAGGVGAFVAIPVVALTLQGTLWFWTHVGYQHPTQHALLQAMQEAPARWVVVVSVLSAVVAAPLFEELLFRGCLQTAVRRESGSAVVAVLTASMPFALIHDAWTWPPIFVFSLLLGVVYERTRSLWSTTVMHALFNGFVITMNLIGG